MYNHNCYSYNHNFLGENSMIRFGFYGIDVRDQLVSTGGVCPLTEVLKH